MTLLNEIPLKGRTKDFLTGKMKRVNVYYAIATDGEIRAICDFGYGLGLGCACLLHDKEGQVLVRGYITNPKEVEIFKYERNKNPRGI